MSRTENRIHLVGYLGSDPNVRWYDSDTCMAILSLATQEDTGMTEEEREGLNPTTTDWHTIYCYRALAVEVAETMGVGDRVSVVGRLTYRSVNNARGMEQKQAIIIAKQVELLEKKKSASAPSAPDKRTNPERYARFFEALDEDPDALPF